MTLGLTVAGGVELAAQLNKLSAGVRRKALLKLLRVAAEPIRGRASELAPIDPTTDLDLKDWIVISASKQIGQSGADGQWVDTETDDFQAAVAIGPARKVFYGLFLEYGTVRMGAHQFMRPAFDYGVDRTLTVIRTGLWDLLQQANAGAGAFKEPA